MAHTNYIAIISVLSTLIFTACTPAPTLVTYRYWHKEGVSTKQTQDTLGHCSYDVGANDLSSEKANKLVSYCMKSKGFILKTGQRYI